MQRCFRLMIRKEIPSDGSLPKHEESLPLLQEIEARLGLDQGQFRRRDGKIVQELDGTYMLKVPEKQREYLWEIKNIVRGAGCRVVQTIDPRGREFTIKKPQEGFELDPEMELIVQSRLERAWKGTIIR